MALIDDIRALPADLLATRDTAQIAAALPPVSRLVPTEIGNGTVLETLGLAVGNALLDVLYNAPDFRYVKPLLEQGRLRIDAPSARAALDGIAAAGIAAGFGAAQAEALRYFESKGMAITWGWREMEAAAHARAFTVAGVTKLDVLQDIRGALQRALNEGRTYAQFKDELIPLLQKKGWWGKMAQTDMETGEMAGKGLTPRRLETIFRANVQSSYMAGRYKAHMENVGDRPWWMYVAIMDSHTRPQHSALNGRTFRYDDPFWQKFYPPNGFNCFPAGTSVRGKAEVGLKTFYAGKMVELRTRLGHRLTVTANHPVLTGRGWLPAHLIEIGDQTLGAAGEVDAKVVGVVNDEQPPTLAEDLFEALAAQGLRVVPMSTHDFHADAHLRKPEIEIATADRRLMDEVDAELQQLVRQRQFGAGNAYLADSATQRAGVVADTVLAQQAGDIAQAGPGLFGDGALRGQPGSVEGKNAPLDVGILGVGGLPGRAALPGHGSGVGLDARPLDDFGLGAITQRYTVPAEQSVEHVAAATGLLGELLEANPGAIALDEVVEIRQFDWAGHVYDFQTETGLMIAGGVIIHNCRCRVRAFTDAAVRKRGIATSASAHRLAQVDLPDPYRPGQTLPRTRFEYAPGKYIAPDIGWEGNPGAMALWDKAATLPDCSWSDAGVADMAARPIVGNCLGIVAGQRTWKDFGRADLRDVPVALRHASPGMVERAATREYAVEVLAAELGLTAEQSRRVIKTPVETLVIWRDLLPHMVEKEADGRERYSRFILPTLLDPFEVYLTEYTDGRMRPRYIGIFQGDRDMMCIVRRNRDGSFLWNLMQADTKAMNRHRVGDLIYGK